MKKIFKAQTLRRQIIALISGQLMLLGLITALVSYQVRLVESKITEVADLKDPSPFTASLCVSLNKITLNLLAYTHNQDKQSLQGVSQGETDFENSLVEFQKMNPRLFPVAAQTKILSAYQPFKESSSDILHAYADQLQKWTDLLDNNDQIVELFERRLRPLIRPGQKQAGQRLDLVSNLEGEVRAIPKDLTAYVIRRGGQEKQVDWNDHKFETLLRIYQHIATIRAERKVLDVIDGLWSDNVALAQHVLQLEDAKAGGFSKLLQSSQNLQTTISAVLPAVRPEVIEAKKNAIFNRITIILVIAGLVVVGGMVSCILSALWLYRRTRRYFQEVKAIAEAVATGDLSQQVSTEGPGALDGMGQSVNRLIGVLRRSEQMVNQLGNIVESSGDASIGMNLEWTILSWNRGAQRLYGYTAEEIKGNSIDALFTPDRRGEIDVLREKLQEMRQVSFDTLHVRKSGATIEVRLIASRIVDSAGNIIGVSLLAREFPVAQHPLTPHSPASKPLKP